jgi:hypothetical protein
VSNKIGFRLADDAEPKVVTGVNATPLNSDKKQQSGTLCWPDLNDGKWDDGTVGFVADVTDIVKDMKLDKKTTYIVTDPVNALNRVGKPNGDNPAPAFPVTDGASLIIFYSIKDQPKTQVLYDFTYDSNFGKDVRRIFSGDSGVNVKKAPSDLILAGPDGQAIARDQFGNLVAAPERTAFIGTTTEVRNDLWKGKSDLYDGKFKIGNLEVGNLWDTIKMKRPKVLKQDTDGQTFEVRLVKFGTNTQKDTDCVGISAVVIVTPQ